LNPNKENPYLLQQFENELTPEYPEITIDDIHFILGYLDKVINNIPLNDEYNEYYLKSILQRKQLEEYFSKNQEELNISIENYVDVNSKTIKIITFENNSFLPPRFTIDIDQFFQYFPLDENFIYITCNKGNKEIPEYKIYDAVNKGIPQNWFYSKSYNRYIFKYNNLKNNLEKYKIDYPAKYQEILNKLKNMERNIVQTHTGIIIKMLFDKNSFDDFLNFQIYRTGRIKITTTTVKAIDKIEDGLKKFIDIFNTMGFSFTDNHYKLSREYFNKFYTYRYNYTKPFLYSKLELYIHNPVIKNLFNIKEQTTNLLLEDIETEIKINIYSIPTNHFIFNHIPADFDLSSIIERINLFISVSMSEKENQFNLEIESDSKEKLKMPEVKKNLKDIKKVLSNFNTRDCQKIRQPHIDKEGNKIPLKYDSYPVEIDNQKFICLNENYPYIGFTKQNNICCFKTNQFNNEKFINNISYIEGYIYSDPVDLNGKIIKLFKILDNIFYIHPNSKKITILQNSKIIQKLNPEKWGEKRFLDDIILSKTDSSSNSIVPTKKINFESAYVIHSTTKILEENRKAYLDPLILKFFNSMNEFKTYQFYRYGIKNGSIVKAIENIMGISLSEILPEIHNKHEIFISIDDYTKQKFENDENKYINYLLTTDQPDYSLTIDYLSKIYNINIFIFEFNDIVCTSIGKDISRIKSSVFLLNNQNSFEIIGAEIGSSIIKKLFENIPKQIFIFYKKKCIVNDPYPLMIKKVMKFIYDKYNTLEGYTQVINKHGKVIYYKTPKGFLIPTWPISLLVGYPYEYMRENLKPSLEIQLNNNPLPEIYKLDGQILEFNDSNNIVGLMYNKLYIIPVQKNTLVKNLPIINENYHEEFDEDILSNINNKDNRISFMDSYEKLEYQKELAIFQFSQKIKEDSDLFEKIKQTHNSKELIRKDKRKKLIEIIPFPVNNEMIDALLSDIFFYEIEKNLIPKPIIKNYITLHDLTDINQFLTN
jgi:hypothetical protein